MKNAAASIGIVCDPKCAAIGVRPLSKVQQQRKGDLTGLEGGCRGIGGCPRNYGVTLIQVQNSGLCPKLSKQYTVYCAPDIGLGTLHYLFKLTFTIDCQVSVGKPTL